VHRGRSRLWIVALLLLFGAEADADILLEAPFPGIAPDGIARDGADGSFWVTSLLDGQIYHFDASLQLLETIASPFGASGNPVGITHHSHNDTLLVLDLPSRRLIEIDRTGVAVGIDAVLPLLPVVNPGGPAARSLTFHPAGDGGNGTIYVVEGVGTLIYEMTPSGEILRTFVHPEDPDGYPGNGNAASSGGIDLFLDSAGEIAGIDLVGASATSPHILRLTEAGVETGFAVDLAEVGAGTGSISGIARSLYTDPTTGSVHDVFYCVDQGNDRIVVVDAELPAVPDVSGLECQVGGGASAQLQWNPISAIDEITIERDGVIVATLAATATTFSDPALADGIWNYAVTASSGGVPSTASECLLVIGAGEVDAIAPIEGVQWILDITEDSGGLLWMVSGDNRLIIHDKDLQWVTEMPGPFPEDDDFPSGIAYRPETGTLLVVNSFDNRMQEIDVDGVPVGPAVQIEIPVPDDEPTFLGGIAYDPGGNGGDGVIFAVEGTRGIIYRLSRSGEVLSSFPHPDEAFEPTPDPSFIDTYCLGISGVPEVAGPPVEIEISGGTAFDLHTTRFFRIDATSGEPSGFQITTEAISLVASRRYLAIHNGDYLGQPCSFVVSIRSNDCKLLRVKREPPEVKPIDFLRCQTIGLEDRVAITFHPGESYDSIAVERDGTVVATIAGDASSWIDESPGSGWHRYRVIPTIAGINGDDRSCQLRVGVGARLGHSFLDPAFSPYQMTRDPDSGTFVVSVNTAALSESFFTYDSNLQFTGTIPAPTSPPWLTAALAIRPTASGSEIWSISWQVPAPWLEPQDFLLTVQAMDGTILWGPAPISIPGPPVGVALTYPAAMAYDADGDLFWFLERNQDYIWQMNTDGILTIPTEHPQPPLQNYVFNLGLDIDADRDSLTLTTAGPFDTVVTEAIGMTRLGVATGEVIPLDDTGLGIVYGLVRDQERAWVCGSLSSMPLMVSVKTADPVAAPTPLECVELAPNEVTLSWGLQDAYDSLRIYRGVPLVATVGGDETTWTDPGVGLGARAWRVTGVKSEMESAPAACSLIVAGIQPQFLRGDVNGDGSIDLSDPILLLGWLFSSAAPLACDDAGDVNDDGALDLSDPISLLGYLFSGGPPPAPPWPSPGIDPTVDNLGCESP